ncbi:LysR substrate-binding domain-containing protein [Jannaschia seohaensis]|uniref:LysR substrate-binding domain-containing protein n=1 Tax=Jannaschia seohaensis TaxID=475081 RepID=UPI000D6BCEF8
MPVGSSPWRWPTGSGPSRTRSAACGTGRGAARCGSRRRPFSPSGSSCPISRLSGAEISIHPDRSFVDVVGEGFDLAIRAGQPGTLTTPPGTDRCLVAPVGLIGIVSPSLLNGAAPDPHALPWLWHDGMETKIQLMRDCGLQTDRLEQRCIGSANLLLEAVRQGLGATIFKAAIAREEIASGGIVEVPLPVAARVDYVAFLPKGPHHGGSCHVQPIRSAGRGTGSREAVVSSDRSSARGASCRQSKSRYSRGSSRTRKRPRSSAA